MAYPPVRPGLLVSTVGTGAGTGRSLSSASRPTVFAPFPCSSDHSSCFFSSSTAGYHRVSPSGNHHRPFLAQTQQGHPETHFIIISSILPLTLAGSCPEMRARCQITTGGTRQAPPPSLLARTDEPKNSHGRRALSPLPQKPNTKTALMLPRHPAQPRKQPTLTSASSVPRSSPPVAC